MMLNYEAPTTKNTYWMVTAVFGQELGLHKEDVIADLRERNIYFRPFSIHVQLAAGVLPTGRPRALEGNNPVSYDIGARAVNLPSGFNMTEALVARVMPRSATSCEDGILRRPRKCRRDRICNCSLQPPSSWMSRPMILAVRRARRRRNYNPNDIYPLWWYGDENSVTIARRGSVGNRRATRPRSACR